MSTATISQGPLSPSQITAPGFYLQILPPPTYVAGAASNVGAVVGSASWGPVNQPIYCGSPQDLLRNFGAVLGPGAPYAGTLLAPNNKYDVVPEALMAFAESGSAGGLGLWIVRVVDGTSNGIATPGGPNPWTPGLGGSANSTAAYASGILVDSVPVHGLTLFGKYPGTLADAITVGVAVGSKGTGYMTVTLTPPGGLGLVQEVYPNIPTAGATISGTAYASQFWPLLQQYIMNGQPNVRGPSLLVWAAASGTGAPSTTAVAPVTTSANNALLPSLTSGASGVDGDTVVGTTPYSSAGLASNQIGSSASTPVTGIYTLAAANPPVMALRVAGFGESASDADLTNGLSTIQAFCDANAIVHYTGLDIADDTATVTAVTSIQTNGQDDWEVVYGKDHGYFNDTVNGSRLFPIAAALMGSKLALPPEISPLNVKLKSVSQTYRTSPQGAPAPYTNPEIGQCQTGRIALITSPSPGGPYLGWNTGVNGSSNPAQSPIEYSHLTNWIAKSLAAFFGKWVGGAMGLAGQGLTDPDPIRSGVTADLIQFFDPLQKANRIAGYSVVCNLSNNTPTTIAQHYLFATAMAKYLASVWFFLMSFTGGTTVNVTVSQNSGV